MLVLSHHFFLVDYLQGVLLALLLDEVDVAEGTLAQLIHQLEVIYCNLP